VYTSLPSTYCFACEIFQSRLDELRIVNREFRHQLRDVSCDSVNEEMKMQHEVKSDGTEEQVK